jgi:hypothetical protein
LRPGETPQDWVHSYIAEKVWKSWCALQLNSADEAATEFTPIVAAFGGADYLEKVAEYCNRPRKRRNSKPVPHVPAPLPD